MDHPMPFHNHEVVEQSYKQQKQVDEINFEDEENEEEEDEDEQIFK